MTREEWEKTRVPVDLGAIRFTDTMGDWYWANKTMTVCYRCPAGRMTYRQRIQKELFLRVKKETDERKKRRQENEKKIK